MQDKTLAIRGSRPRGESAGTTCEPHDYFFHRETGLLQWILGQFLNGMNRDQNKMYVRVVWPTHNRGHLSTGEIICNMKLCCLTPGALMFPDGVLHTSKHFPWAGG